MRNLLRAAALVLLLTAALAAAALTAALQREPAVPQYLDTGANDLPHALALLRMHDPRRARPGVARAVQISERELNLLLQHGALRRLDARARVSLLQGTASVRASLSLPGSPLGGWLNVEVRLLQTGGLPVVEALQIGELRVPAWLAGPALRLAARHAGVEAELQVATEVVQRVTFMPQRLGVVYAWRDDSAARVLAALLPAAAQQRLRVYAEQLARVAAGQQAGWTVSLAPLLGPMFELAQQRSSAPGADAVAENRAALVVLALFVNGRGVDALLPAARAWPRARPLQVTLGGRDDFPRHLLISAALVVEGTGPLSRAIGVYKEVADARNGSGFSFNDMAANLAGTRLGEWAVAQPQRLQSALARGVQESDVMPPWADLPEFMGEAEFQRRYGGVGAPAYEAMVTEIERRVAALALWR